MSIDEARFREATLEESNFARGGFFYRISTTPVSWALKTWGTYQLLKDRTQYILGERPLAIRIWDNVKTKFGYGPTVIEYFPSFIINAKHLTDPIIVREFFKHHRSDENSIFASSSTMKEFAKIMKDCFPQMHFFILDCPEIHTKIFHSLLKTKFSENAVAGYKDSMKTIALNLIYQHENKDAIDAILLAQDYFSKIFGDNIAECTETGLELSTQLSELKKFLVKITRNKMSEFDSLVLNFLKKRIQHTVQTILNFNPEIFSETFEKISEDTPLNEDDKKALIFAAFFGAHDNTKTLLATSLWYLATHQDDQATLRNSIKDFDEKGYPIELEHFFAKMIKEYSPAPGIARLAAKDICIEYSVSNEITTRKAFLLKDDIVVAKVCKIAKNIEITGNKAQDTYFKAMNFGSAIHKCPGRIYAETAIKEFFFNLLKDHEVTMEEINPIDFQLGLTLEITTSIPINIIRINDSKIE